MQNLPRPRWRKSCHEAADTELSGRDPVDCIWHVRFFILTGIYRDTVDPLIGSVWDSFRIFPGIWIPTGGSHILLAAVILTIMVIPTIIALSQDAMRAVPKEYAKDPSLGATRWETAPGS